MHMTCDHDYWAPEQAEVEHLALFGAEAHAIVAIGDVDCITPWQIGRAAGFSGGTTSDEAMRRSNWASAASKATKLNKKTLPHIAALKERLVQFRSDGGEPQSVSWKDKLIRCEWLILHGTPSESLRAIEMHNKMKGMGDSTPKATDVVAELVAKVGPTAACEALTLLGAKNLANIVPMIDAEVLRRAEADELRGLNCASAELEVINKRMDKLEVQKNLAGAQA